MRKIMRKIRETPEGKEKQKEIDNLSKKKIRETPEGGKRHQESMRKIRETPEGKEKQKEIDNVSKRKTREKPEGKEKQREIDNVSKKKVRENIRFDKEAAFQEVKEMSMVDPSILDTNAYKIIEKDFLEEINEGPEYKCEICICLNYKKSVS